MLLEKAVSEGRANLEKLSDVSLVVDYRKFKYNKVISRAIMKEMERRAKETKYFRITDWQGTDLLILKLDSWEYRRISDNPTRMPITIAQGEYLGDEGIPIEVQEHFIGFGSKLFAAIDIRATIAAIRRQVKRIRQIRYIIQQTGERQKYFSEFYQCMKKLEKLDPFYPDLYFGISGKPFFEGMIDA